jgi:hypothetical protein
MEEKPQRIIFVDTAFTDPVFNREGTSISSQGGRSSFFEAQHGLEASIEI